MDMGAWDGADMEFVKNFTHPDFQAKNFTPQKRVNCDIFLQINSVNASNINNLGICFVINELISSTSTVLEMK